MDYQALSNQLIGAYGKLAFTTIDDSINRHQRSIVSKLDGNDRKFVASFANLSTFIARYNNPHDLLIAESMIDLDKLYRGAETRDDGLELQDRLMLELLHYFKHDFFTWITKPACSNCGKADDNIVMVGVMPPPTVNPDEITRTELYKCNTCDINVSFPRINHPVKLLHTRRGRCGEWVNCFMLVMKAVLGEDAKTRYVWNNEDHVWCEYYSNHLKRWIHVDPCEAAFDQPHLYTDNWGKKMSWVIGINDEYIIDLSEKYIGNNDKKIDKQRIVSNVAAVNNFITLSSFQQMKRYIGNDTHRYVRFYHDCLIPYRTEKLATTTTNNAIPSLASLTIKGRQLGSSEWTKARGEDGT